MEHPALSRIAIIGAGSAGLDFALRCLRAGLHVTLEDVMPSRLRRAQQLTTTPGAPPMTKAPESPEPSSWVGSNEAHPTLHLASTIEDAVRSADLAIDFVPDELESKLEIFSLLDRMAPPRTILLTPTTALSIADLASCTYRPQLCFAVQFPAPGSAHLIHTAHSSPQALSAIEHLLHSLHFTVTTTIDPAHR